jgi:HEAT repeat protein
LVVGDDESLHGAAAVALGRWARPDSFDFLHQYLDEAEDDPAKRRPAMIAIGHLGGQQAVDPLIRWLLLEPEVAGEALALVGEPAERPLIRLIRDDRAELAAGACEILGRIGGLRSKVALESLLRRPGIDPSVRRAAEASLESIGQRLSPPADQGGD